MYQCYIIDDESYAIETLKKYAEDSGQLEVVGTSQNPLEAIRFINEHKKIDITFLDIDMPEMSGLDVADNIFANTAIIFTTGHAGYAVNGFEKNISDFLLKPISFARFMKSLTKVAADLEKKNPMEQKNDTYFFVNPGIKGKMLKINYADVIYIEGLNNYVIIHTPAVSHTIYLTMKEMEAGLKPDFFLRIHKSYIINIDKVTQMEGNTVMVEDIQLPVGSSYKEKLANKIGSYSIKTQRGG
jgi:DNA-binding LytR/AlgR family response regulator